MTLSAGVRSLVARRLLLRGLVTLLVPALAACGLEPQPQPEPIPADRLPAGLAEPADPAPPGPSPSR